MSASTSNQALSALLFLYRHVVVKDLGRLEDLPRGRPPDRLPVVLTRDEVRRVLGRLSGVVWLVVALLYGAGLRITSIAAAHAAASAPSGTTTVSAVVNAT